MSPRLNLLLTLTVLIFHPVSAREYFVAIGGDDGNEGTSMDAAFASIQRGVDALSAGDTLTIGPGEYFESIHREGLGSDDAETVIRAAIPGTVLVHGNVPLSGFEKVEGTRFVYMADFDQQPYSIGEVDTLSLLNEAIYLDELEFFPGTYFYDAGAGKLYLSSTDLQSANEHVYRVSVTPRHGLHLQSPVRVMVDGLAFTGFHFNEALSLRVGATMWGAVLENARHSTLRNCIAYLNGGGLLVMNERGGEYNTIEYSTAYANNSRHNNEGGNIAIIRGGANDVLRGNYVYRSPGHGQRFYISDQPGKLMEDSFGWANESGDLWIKGVREPYISRRNSALGGNPRGSTHSLYGTSSERRESDVDGTNIFLGDFSDLDLDVEFADARHFNFRLQSTSRFRGAGEGGRDLGPHPYTGTILFVTPDGDDRNDGLSVATALATIGAALERAGEGFTLYLEGGHYSEDVTINQSNISVRRRGVEPVVLSGEISIIGAEDVELKRLMFFTGVEAIGSSALTVDNCLFHDGATFYGDDLKGVTFTHNLFTQTVELESSSGVFLAGNIFAAAPGLSIDGTEGGLYSDYNSYVCAGECWNVAGSPISLDRLQAHRDRQSLVAEPDFLLAGTLPAVANTSSFAGRGPLGAAVGPWFEGDVGAFRMVGPHVFSTTATTVNLEWWTSTPAVVMLEWGETPEMGNSRMIHSHNFGSYSITGLKPESTCYFALTPVEPYPGLVLNDWLDFSDTEMVTGSVTTDAVAHDPRTYYVATDGDDNNDGLSRAAAWRTLNHAAREVRPGDTVEIGGGHYRETVWLRNSGEQGLPITFRGASGERVEFDGSSRRLFAAIYGVGKHHYVFDSLYAGDLGHVSTRGGSSLALELGGMYTLSFCTDMTIRRSLMDGRGVMYSPALFTVESCSGVVVDNCVQIGAMDRARVINSPDVRISNTVFFRDLISNLVVENHPDQVVTVENSIFVDSLPKKGSAPMITTGRIPSIVINNNCFYTRQDDGDKTLVFIYGDAAFERVRIGFLMSEAREEYPVVAENTRLTFTTLDTFYPDSNSIEVNPEFAIFAPAPQGLGRITVDSSRFAPDSLRATAVDFNDFFATNEIVVRRGIGLQPSVFSDFNFTREKE